MTFRELGQTLALAPVAKRLLGEVCTRVFEHRATQQMRNLLELDVVQVELVEARAFGVTAEKHVVLSQGRPDEADIAEVRPRAAVGAPRHPVADARIRDAGIALYERDLTNQRRHRPLRLGNRKAAGGVCRARHRMPDRGGLRLGARNSPTIEDGRQDAAVSVGEIGEQDVLLGSEPELRTQGLDGLAQCGPQAARIGVIDTSVLDEQPVAVVAISLLVPTEVVVDGAPVQRARRLELERDP